ncbi:hypothetical protein GCM10011609_14950 [Lentzea pudingi]|uniref:SCP1.201-like deaminase n=1 Tax=Lentzea pudingi TaxID=1789439 RepID=A0ABQ2HHN9_9PSEU|nr:hypothetical protein [Lentzea pudingi]GGM80107.1 hypothetical protein GCM10011609_14950 [Lentzea pudingi]
MFGSARRTALETKVAELEQQVRALSGQLEAVRPLLADAARLDALAARAAVAVGTAEPLGERVEARLDTPYLAERTGFVSVYFDGGRTARVKLLVGPENPPTYCVGEVYADHLGGVVRAGEWWIAESNSKRPGLRVHFTPLF